MIGGKADDPFWSRVKKGADAAKLIRTALSQKPDAIVGPDWVPEAMDAAFKEVVAAGVPLIIYNAGGMEAAKRLGAPTAVAQAVKAALQKAPTAPILTGSGIVDASNVAATVAGAAAGAR